MNIRGSNQSKQEYVNLLHNEINSLIIENEKLRKILKKGISKQQNIISDKWKNFELFNSQEDIGTITEKTIISWDPVNISKNHESSENPNNKKALMARDYDLDFFNSRVEIKSSAAKKYFKDEDGKWRQRYNVASDYEGNFRFSAKNIRKSNLWDYLIFVVYYLDKEDMYLFRYDELTAENLGVSLSPLNVNQSKVNNNYQFTLTHLSVKNIDRFKKTKEEIMKIIGDENGKKEINTN